MNNFCFTNNLCMLNKADQTCSGLPCSARRSKPPDVGDGEAQNSYHVVKIDIYWALRSRTPGSQLLWQCLVYCLEPEAPLFREMPTEAKAFLSRSVCFGFALHLDPTLKRPCAILYCSWNKTDQTCSGLLCSARRSRPAFVRRS